MTLENRIVVVVSAIGADVKSAQSRLNAVEGRGELFVQSTPPSSNSKYMWIQTDYGVPGSITLWIEDGQP